MKTVANKNGARAWKKVAAGVITLVIAIAVVACGGSSSDDSGTIDLVAYSTPETLYQDSIEPAYQKTDDGSGVEFKNSFGGSGDQSRAVEAGLPADVVHLALEPDVTRLVDAGIVADDWQQQDDYNGIVQNSVVVFLVRAGNPKDIQDWDDLVRDDVEVLTPNPFTSGGARWNIMAAYGAQLAQGKSEDEALDYLQQLFDNVPVQDKSASEALATFTGGKGDVLLAYENEALRAQDAGEDVEYVVPDDTIKIETPIAVTEDASDDAQSFVDYLFSPDGQREFAEGGYRPVDPDVLAQYKDKFPTPPGLFTIDEFGGWDTVTDDFFDPESGSVAQIEQNLGVATE